MNTQEKRAPFCKIMPLIEESFRQGLTVTLPVTGNSMWPLFAHKRDCAILSKYNGTPLRRGDVPLYQRPDGQYVLHRVVKVTPEGYWFTGDAQRKLEYLPQTCVLAVMTGFIRKGHTVDCHNKWYRLYVFLWMAVRPIRPFLIRGAKFLYRLKKH